MESTSGVEDWITDHAGDPDLMDLSLMTEGTHYCKIEIPKRMQRTHQTGIRVTNLSGGVGYPMRTGVRFEQFIGEGLLTSRSNAEKIEQFLQSDRHTDADTSTFKKYYLVVYYGSNDHELFTDETSTQQHYCAGAIEQWNEIWTATENMTKLIQLQWKSAWE